VALGPDIIGRSLGNSSGIGTLVPGYIVPGVFANLFMDLKRAMAINVRLERHARNISQEELADRAGLSAREQKFRRVSQSSDVSPKLCESTRAN
jgi:hypothetical protein